VALQNPVPVDRFSTERFLWALFNLGRKGKPFSPEYLADDFGASSAVAIAGVKAFYHALVTLHLWAIAAEELLVELLHLAGGNPARRSVYPVTAVDRLLSRH
jgi:hypothetical protein